MTLFNTRTSRFHLSLRFLLKSFGAGAVTAFGLSLSAPLFARQVFAS